MTGDSQLERAAQAYERAVFGGDAAALPAAERDLDRLEADLALARGRLLHARFLGDRQEDPRELGLFERAAELYQLLGDIRGEGEALFWVGVVHQVIRGDPDRSLPDLERSYQLASRAGDELTMSYAARHLGFAAAIAGRLDAAKERLEESLELRRRIGFQPGVAAALLALAEFAHRGGRPEDARALLEEADAVAVAAGAHGIRRWIAAQRAEVEQPAAAPDGNEP